LARFLDHEAAKNMLDPAVVALVRTMRAEGLSYRQIAERLGISRGSVAAIVNGRRREPGDADKKPELVLSGLKTRCPGCGRAMYLPVDAELCLACLRSGGPDLRRPAAGEGEAPAIELRGGPAAWRRLQAARREAMKRLGIRPGDAAHIDEDAVREKQRRVELGSPGDETEWRRVEDDLDDDVEGGDEG